MKAGIITIGLLIISNVFMTAAWYGNLKLKEMHISTDWPLILVILASWGIALLEYFFMIPANNIGSRINGGPFSLMQLKIIQEAISITVFTIISVTVFNSETLQWNHIVAFALIIGAVFFAFLK
ncbi:MAG: DMT family protein [Fibrobacter sp.]|nr:DMT family protein [Fibrobacter sp.]